MRWALHLAAITLVLLGVLALTRSAPQPWSVTIGAPDDEAVAEFFFSREDNGTVRYRWTQGASFLNLSQPGQPRAQIVRLRVSGPRATPEHPTDLTLWADGQVLARTAVGIDWRVQQVLLPAPRLPWQPPGLWLFSPTSDGSGPDIRALGVAVSEVRVSPLGLPRLLPGWRALFGLAALILLRQWVCLWLRPRAASALALAAGLAMIGLSTWNAGAFDGLIRLFWMGVLAGGVILCGILWFWHWRSRERPPAASASVASATAGPAATALLVALSVLLGLIGLLSLQWRLLHDSPLLFYAAYAIDQLGTTPYRELFEQNMPLSYAFYGLVGELGAYGDFGFRVADLLYLALISAATWALLARFGRQVAWAAIVIFGLLYLRQGAGIGLQREFLMILPLTLAIWVAAAPLPLTARGLLAGLGVGLMAAIKPQALVFAVPLALFLLLDRAVSGPRLARAVPALALLGLGAVLPLLITAAHLWNIGALEPFLAMWRDYLPLFAELNVAMELVSGPARTTQIVQSFLNFGGYWIWLPAAICGVVLAVRWAELDPSRRRLVWLLVGVTAAASLTVLAAGKFWEYHWLPFHYGLVLLASLCLTRPAPAPARAALLREGLPLALVALTALLVVRPPSEYAGHVVGQANMPPSAGRADQIASYLGPRLQPGDLVQPLDWTAGALHAMLLTGAHHATPYIYDIHFYHHVDTPYIQGLRRDLIAQLEARRPRYIVQITTRKPWVPAPGAPGDFPELRTLIAERYSPALQGTGYIIYSRR